MQTPETTNIKTNEQMKTQIQYQSPGSRQSGSPASTLTGSSAIWNTKACISTPRSCSQGPGKGTRQAPKPRRGCSLRSDPFPESPHRAEGFAVLQAHLPDVEGCGSEHQPGALWGRLLRPLTPSAGPTSCPSVSDKSACRMLSPVAPFRTWTTSLKLAPAPALAPTHHPLGPRGI